MKNYQPILKMSDKQLAQFRSKLSTDAIELGWKADKTSYRLKSRLEREAKRHVSLEPTKKLLADALIIREALLPLGESDALKLVENQIAAFEEKINDTINKYRLLSEAEIAVKEMQLLLMRQKVEILKENVVAVEDEMRARASLKEVYADVEPVTIENQEEKGITKLSQKTQPSQPPAELILYSKEGVKLKLLPRISAFLSGTCNAVEKHIGWNFLEHSYADLYVRKG